MSALVAVLSRLYRGLLRLYPPSYRAEFGDELVSVFEQALCDASAQGSRATLFWAFRELRDLPGVLIRTHLNWRKTDMDNSIFPHASDQTPWRTALLSLAPYLIVGPLSAAMSYHGWWNPQDLAWRSNLFIGLVCAVIVLSFVLGVIHQFPRWSYPSVIYLILLLTFGVTYLYNGTPWDVNHEGNIFLLVLGGSFLAIWLLPPLRPFFRNIKQDWTLLSYGMYACTLLLVTTQDHDEIPNLNLLVVMPAIIWLLGALAYLRLPSAKMRFAVLLLSIFMGVAFWWYPVFDGNSGSWAGFAVVSGIMLAIAGVLIGLVIAPILIGVVTSSKLIKRTPA